MTRAVISTLCVALPGITAITSPLAGQVTSREGAVVGRIVSISENRSSVTIAPREGGRGTVWPISDLPDARERAKAYRVGDVVGASTAERNGQMQIVAASPLTVPVPFGTRLAFVGASALILWLVASLWAPGGARWLILGEDNRYSNSKVQFALWSWLVLTVYIATIGIRLLEGGLAFFGGINVPANLLWLSGISAVTFAGAKQLVASRIDSSPRLAALVKPPPIEGPKFPRDLVTDDSGRRVDLGDFQMLIITLIAVIVYGIRVFGWLGSISLEANVDLPDVDTTLLSAFGVGQAAYLAKKATGDAGTTAAAGAVDDRPPPRPPFALPR